MELALNEIKTQAKIKLKAIKSGKQLIKQPKRSPVGIKLPDRQEIQLKHCLIYIAQELGFKNWHHAQHILSGSNNQISLGMGKFFYPKGASYFINEWFSDYQEAKQVLDALETSTAWLLPYNNQFIIVKSNYIDIFKLDNQTSLLWTTVRYDMVASYNTLAWDQITYGIIKNRPKLFSS